ncbi:hypothetical protein ACFE04_030496 [Oxalis oulophora]
MGVEEKMEDKINTTNPSNVVEEDNAVVENGGQQSSSAASASANSITHPLEHSWTFWFDNPQAKSKQATWGSSMRSIFTFATVEEFWSLYNNIHHPSKLLVGADFHCFKYKIEPKWEDPVCANGGKWTVQFPRGKSDTSWLYTLLAMIGEQFDHGDDICGAVVSVRGKQEKIALWTKNAANEAAQLSIGRQWKEFLDYNDSIGFIFHEDARKHDRNAKNRYTI